MPRRKRKDELPQIDVCAAWVQRRARILLWRRRPDGLYGGLWELPQQASLSKLIARFAGRLEIATKRAVAAHEQVLSHRRLRIRVWPASLAGRAPAAPKQTHDRSRWHDITLVDEQGISSATRAIINRYQESQQWKRRNAPSISSSKATARS